MKHEPSPSQPPIKALSDKHDADVLLYVGEISRTGYQKVVSQLEPAGSNANRKNVILVLGTTGGDPDAAFRIARKLRSSYERIIAMVLMPCKSAGTLICLGADEIVMSDNGELGPLDVQMRKDDEILRFGSGLDVMQTLNFLEQRALESFRLCLLDVHTGAGLSTKLAGELANALTAGLYSPILSQLDPVRLGEVHRSMNIAAAYGHRLAEGRDNVKQGAISELITSYPSHGFVIDREEAKNLFKYVREPDALELEALDLGFPARALSDHPFVSKIGLSLAEVDIGLSDEVADSGKEVPNEEDQQKQAS